jgi:hypothetical protein
MNILNRSYTPSFNYPENAQSAIIDEQSIGRLNLHPMDRLHHDPGVPAVESVTAAWCWSPGTVPENSISLANTIQEESKMCGTCVA